MKLTASNQVGLAALSALPLLLLASCCSHSYAVLQNEGMRKALPIMIEEMKLEQEDVDRRFQAGRASVFERMRTDMQLLQMTRQLRAAEGATQEEIDKMTARLELMAKEYLAFTEAKYRAHNASDADLKAAKMLLAQCPIIDAPWPVAFFPTQPSDNQVTKD